ncbi:hypothetical protein C9374_009622 [Naegleria lovaniensis]|uniref:Uncharacterized protein n=1 Tax=Naegleria lovaniensis TaxID=51637 RepID=A0AA88H1F5_NAELO|nr:uncharacterized protein C9374_009622 [Naegleria lovaniensis]KAG2393045.1 hypothetical protein C9374_009622 [Naegleria lovaniensis]
MQNNSQAEQRIRTLYRWLNPQQTAQFFSSDSVRVGSDNAKETSTKEASLFPSKEEILERAKLIEQNRLDDEELYKFSCQFGPVSKLTRDKKIDLLKLIENSGIDLPSEYKMYLDDLIENND